MVYSTVEAVRERLSITNDQHDAQITNKLTQATNWIDRQILPYEAVPLGAPDQDIIDAEADIAAGLFREETAGKWAGERPMPHVLRQRGEATVLDWIKANYLGPVERKGFMRHTQSHHSWESDHASRG